MMFIICMFLMLLMMSMLIIFINLLLSMKLMKNREKMSPFECGFDPMSMSRLPFSIQFFMISLIFLIFDIEITLLIPLIYLMTIFNKMIILSSLLFMIILISGLMIEYLEHSIDWKI